MFSTDALTQGLRESQPSPQARACRTTYLFIPNLTFGFAALVLDPPLDSPIMDALRWSAKPPWTQGLATDLPPTLQPRRLGSSPR